jgi:hypothetical protein
MPSLFAFNFRLSPWEACLNLNFHQAELAPGFGAVCTRDQLAVFWVGDPQRNDDAREYALELARALVHAHAFCSFPQGLVLEVEPVTWLEIPNCETANTVTGYMHPTLDTTPLHREHLDNAPLRRAADLVRALVGMPHASIPLQMALGDFHGARRERGPYAAFYAFRVLEDVGFSFGATNQDKPDWVAMNTALNTDEGRWRLLTEAGTAARHLSEKKLVTPPAASRQELLALAHEALTLALKHRGILAGPAQ